MRCGLPPKSMTLDDLERVAALHSTAPMMHHWGGRKLPIFNAMSRRIFQTFKN